MCLRGIVFPDGVSLLPMNPWCMLSPTSFLLHHGFETIFLPPRTAVERCIMASKMQLKSKHLFRTSSPEDKGRSLSCFPPTEPAEQHTRQTQLLPRCAAQEAARYYAHSRTSNAFFPLSFTLPNAVNLTSEERRHRDV